MDEIEENIILDNDFDTVLANVVKDKGGSPELYKDMLNKIAYHESAGTMDPKIKQYSGGPGRGKYQFEGKDGSNRILSSAVRTKNYFRKIGAKVPKFVESIINKGTEDATNLTSEQQDVLALADLRMKGGLDLKDYVTGKIQLEDIWADHWWAGSKDLRDKKVKSFRNSIGKLKPMNDINQNKPLSLNREVELTERNIPVQKDNTAVAQTNMKLPQPISKSNNDSPTMFKEDLGSYLNNYMQSMSSNENNKLNSFNGGGTHEQNPLGGIPLGTGSNGKPNTVEEKETIFKLSDGKYVFSDRLKL